MDAFEDSIKSLVTDKKTGEVTGFRLNKVSGYFDFSKPEYRDATWDRPVVGGVFNIGVSPRDPATDGTRRFWVKRLERLDEDDGWDNGTGDPGPDPFVDGGPTTEHPRQEAVQRVRDAEQDREIRLDRRKAIECAAEVVVSSLAYIATVDDKGHLSATDAQIAQLIDLCITRFRAGLD